jgi:hypothetical protein
MMRPLLPLWRTWRLFILSRGLESLCRRNPTHPDIPLILMELSYWREQ